MPRIRTYAFVLLWLLQGFELQAAVPELPIAPYLNDQVVAVAKLDVGRVNVAATVKLLESLLPPDLSEVKPWMSAAATVAQGLVDAAKHAGLQDVYVVVSMADIPVRPPLVIALVKPAGDPKAVTDVLSSGKFEAREPVGNAILCGTREQVQHARDMAASPRPDLIRALAEGGPAPLKVVAALAPDNGRVIREVLAPLPAEFGGLTGPQLADGLQCAALSVDLPPQPVLRAVIQASDADAAKTLARVIEATTNQLRQQAEVRKTIPQIDALVRELLPKCEGSRLTLTLEQENLQRLVTLLSPSLQAARGTAQRAQSMNNLKQIALAMHMVHDQHKCFPAPASLGADGKRLLSWRVHLLPYLDQETLYRQFHLDEPWDSQHNRPLIAQLPPVFTSPLAPADLASKGLTTYVVPVGNKTVFGGREGTPMSQITDGTSNTILVVEAQSSAAVIWTKPDDLAVDMQTPLKGFIGQSVKGFLAAFCDGSVRFIADSVEPETVRRLLQMNDGQPVAAP